MKPLNEFMPINEGRIPTVNGDSELKPSTMSFKSMKEYVKYVETSWDKALKDKQFVIELESIIESEVDNWMDSNYNPEDGISGTLDIEETGIMYKGDAYSFWIMEADENGADSIDLAMRPEYIRVSGKGGDKFLSFSNPLEIDGEPYDAYEDQYDSPKLKALKKKVDAMIEKAFEDYIDNYEEYEPPMTDREFHAWANPGLGR